MIRHVGGDEVEAPAALRQRVLRLLARREYTRAELERKLSGSAEPPPGLRALLDEFETRQLLSDARYAETRVLGRAARWGNRRMACDLRAHGVPDILVDEALRAAEALTPEFERARAVWAARFASAAAGGVSSDARESARQARFLLARGFSPDVVRRVLRTLPEEFTDE